METTPSEKSLSAEDSGYLVARLIVGVLLIGLGGYLVLSGKTGGFVFGVVGIGASLTAWGLALWAGHGRHFPQDPNDLYERIEAHWEAPTLVPVPEVPMIGAFSQRSLAVRVDTSLVDTVRIAALGRLVAADPGLDQLEALAKIWEHDGKTLHGVFVRPALANLAIMKAVLDLRLVKTLPVLLSAIESDPSGRVTTDFGTGERLVALSARFVASAAKLDLSRLAGDSPAPDGAVRAAALDPEAILRAGLEKAIASDLTAQLVTRFGTELAGKIGAAQASTVAADVASQLFRQLGGRVATDVAVAKVASDLANSLSSEFTEVVVELATKLRSGTPVENLRGELLRKLTPTFGNEIAVDVSTVLLTTAAAPRPE